MATKLISWAVPTQREDGSALTGGEIFGYRIRQTVGNDVYYFESATNSYTISDVGGDYGVIEIAVIDTQFVTSEYSLYVAITNTANLVGLYTNNATSPICDCLYPLGNRPF